MPVSRAGLIGSLFVPGVIGALIAISIVDGALVYASPKWLAILFLVAVSLVHGGWAIFHRKRIDLDLLDGCVWGFAAYAALSLLWSPDPLSGTLFLIKFSLAALLFVYIKNTLTPTAANLIAFSVIAASLVVLTCEWWAFPVRYGLFGNENYVTEFFLLTLPFCLLPFLDKTFPGGVPVRIISGGLFLATLHYFTQSPSKIEFFTGLGLAWIGVAWLITRLPLSALWRGLILLAMLIGSSGLMAAGWTSHGLGGSVLPRVVLYLNTLLMWWSSPLVGHGAGSFQSLYPLFKERHYEYIDFEVLPLHAKETLSGAAHNEILELLASFGVVGLGIALFFSGWLLIGLRRGGPMAPTARVGLLVVLMSGCNALIEFPWQNPATLLLTLIGLGFVAHASRTPRLQLSLPAPVRHALRITPLLLLPLFALAGYRFHTAELYQVSGAVRQQSGQPEAALTHYLTAYDLDPLTRQHRLQLYPALIGVSEQTGASPLSPEENDRLFQISLNGNRFEPLLLLARMQYLFNSGQLQDNMAEARRHMATLTRASSHMADARLTEAYFSLLIKEFEQARQAIAAGLRLPGLTDRQKMLFQQLQHLLAQAQTGAGT